MRFDLFEKFSPEEAKEFLEQFRALESSNIEDLLKQGSSEGLSVDFKIKSVAPLMRWLAAKLATIPNKPDMQLPWWIRATDSYAKNLFEFEEGSKILIIRAAYYLGESFVRSHPGLHWATGNPKTAEANMPVVAGFQFKLEMAPLMVAENLFRRAIAEPTKLGDIDKAIEYWDQKA
jgi:hypothetical protein